MSCPPPVHRWHRKVEHHDAKAMILKLSATRRAFGVILRAQVSLVKAHNLELRRESQAHVPKLTDPETKTIPVALMPLV